MANSLQQTAVMAVLAFAAFSLFLVMVHEMHVLHYDTAAVIQGGKIFHRLEVFIKEEVASLEHGLGFADDDDDNTVIQKSDSGQAIIKTLGENGHSSGVAFKINGPQMDDDEDDKEEEKDNKKGEAASGGGQSNREEAGSDADGDTDTDDAFDDDSVVVQFVGEAKKREASTKRSSSAGLRGERASASGTGAGAAGKGQGQGKQPDSGREGEGEGSWWETLDAFFGTTTPAASGSAKVRKGDSTASQSQTQTQTQTDDKDDPAVSRTAVERDAAGLAQRISDGSGKSVSGSGSASSAGSSRDRGKGQAAPVPAPEKKKKKRENVKETDSSASSTGKGSSSASASDGGDSPPALKVPSGGGGGGGGGKRRQAKGQLVCKGQPVDSEVVYWKVVEGDQDFESPISPHHANHDDRYISYEYDQGGWNNVRMSMECLIVLAHATGRTIVVPPQQNLYLLGEKHQDPEDKKAHAQMGFEDFFDLDLLYSHKGFHMMHMQDFLAKEGVSGGLHGKLPPGNSTKSWGGKLWKYLDDVADLQPEWMGRFVALPGVSKGGDFDLSEHQDPQLLKKMQEFGGGRSTVYYDEQMQKVHHIHFPADNHHRVLQHFYAWVFFANPDMASFYKRFIRDYMRYKDPIQCAGAELLGHVRRDALAADPSGGGDFYALHVRRGDFQFKEVKIGAKEIAANLQGLIPKGAVVYLSTDDPDGVCLNCLVQRKPCDSYPKGSKPAGCPEDCSWKAFEEAGWKVRMLRDYLKQGDLQGANPNWYGMIESIVCSRAKRFAGTYFSTFTGYIHRLRGYHGLGDETYYHHAKFMNLLRQGPSVGHGFSREWKMGWTEDNGDPI